jgi:putative hydrolase of the HAD superfamily
LFYHSHVIFFDLDETLVDDKAATVAGIVALRRFRPETVDHSGFLEKWLLLSDTMFQRYLDGVPEYQSHAYRRRKRIQSIWPELTDSAADRISADYLAAYESSWTAFDDVLPCLDVLSCHRFGVITNGQTEQQIQKLVQTGLKSRFDVIVVSSEVGAAKPDQRIFAEACRRAGESADQCWHVGDRIDKDPLPAVAAGLHGVWLNRDLNIPVDPRVPTIRGLTELPELLAKSRLG